MRKHCTKLEDLTLTFDMNDEFVWKGAETLGDLKALTGLRRLITVETALVDKEAEVYDVRPGGEVPNRTPLVEKLPTTLEFLVLFACRDGEETDGELVTYLGDQITELIRDPRFTRLRHVALERNRGYEWEDEDACMVEESAEQFALVLPTDWQIEKYRIDKDEDLTFFRLVLTKKGHEAELERAEQEGYVRMEQYEGRTGDMRAGMPRDPNGNVIYGFSDEDDDVDIDEDEDEDEDDGLP